MTDPRLMCRKHLLGEHVEHHMFLGSIKKDVDMTGYLKGNLLELWTLTERHDEIVVEMLRRGYNHKTPLEGENDYVPTAEKEWAYVKIDRASAAADLYRRCAECTAILANPSLIEIPNG